jgi:hypothetical protein
MQESSLHASLKDWYSKPGDLVEEAIDGFLIDIVHGHQMIEIQTRNFSALKHKLSILLDRHPVRLVHPIAREKWIIRISANDEELLSRRKSPRHGRLEHLFQELVRIPHLAKHPNFSLEVLIIREEEVRRDDGKGSWRRNGQSIADRRLLSILDRHIFISNKDYLDLLPEDLSHPFTNIELARALSISSNLAAKMTYCLRMMDALNFVGKRGNAHLYEAANSEWHTSK